MSGMLTFSPKSVTLPPIAVSLLKYKNEQIPIVIFVGSALWEQKIKMVQKNEKCFRSVFFLWPPTTEMTHVCRWSQIKHRATELFTPFEALYSTKKNVFEDEMYVPK